MPVSGNLPSIQSMVGGRTCQKFEIIHAVKNIRKIRIEGKARRVERVIFVRLVNLHQMSRSSFINCRLNLKKLLSWVFFYLVDSD